MAVTETFINQVSEALDNLGYAVDSVQEGDIITDLANVDNDVVLPGMEQDDNGTFLRYIAMKLSAVKSYLDAQLTSFQTAWNSLSSEVSAATTYANTQGTYAKNQGDYAKAKANLIGNTASTETCESIIDELT